LKWVDESAGFVINNQDKFVELLPQYFNTTKLKSFLRQLYMYGFQVQKADGLRIFCNPNFIKGNFHDTVKAKKQKKGIESKEMEELETTYKVLQYRYKVLLKSVIDLRTQIQQTIDKNIENVESIVDFKFYFSERIKAMLMMLVINALYHEPAIYEDVNNHTKNQSYIKIKKLEPYVDEFKHFEKSPETLKLHIQTTILSPLNYNSYLAKLVRVSFRYFNKRFFKMQSKKFYSIMLTYMFRDEHISELEDHPNFKAAELVKTNFKLMYDKVVEDYISEDFQKIFQSIYKSHRIEILPSSEDNSESSSETRFSIRSLSNQLGINYSDLFLFLKPDFDE